MIKNKDHTTLGHEMKLFHQQKEAPGSIFWHYRGSIIFNKILNYIREVQKKDCYQEIKTPSFLSCELWEKSGHIDKFGENMYLIKKKNISYGLKPMNCPCHIQVFNYQKVNYKNLPIRFSEFGSCFRNEPSGSVNGLMRLNNFTQDDGHIFCEEKDIESETVKFCTSLKKVYQKFGFKNIKIKFSDRPKRKIGSDEMWDIAEKQLKVGCEKCNLKYDMNKGEGAFYGPKLEFILQDNINREWQCGTMQLDYFLPYKLHAKYTNYNNESKHPIIIHRAILGSIERFIAVLLEKTQGKLPLWLCPIPVYIFTVKDKCNDYASEISQKLKNNNIENIFLSSSATVDKKIAIARSEKIPFIILIGEKEIQEKKLSLNFLYENKIIKDSYENTLSYIKNKINE